MVVSGKKLRVTAGRALTHNFSSPQVPLVDKSHLPSHPSVQWTRFLFVLANFSMATFMDPGVFPRGNRNGTVAGVGGALKIQAKGGASYPNTQVAE